MAGYPGSLNTDPVQNSTSENKESALSGSDTQASLQGPGEDDYKLRDKILTHLKDHTEYDTDQIKVSVEEGFVSLTGLAGNFDAVASIEALVRNVSGVVDVVNHIEQDNSSSVPQSLSGRDSLSIPSPS